jgi:propanediol dehydratase small subunit
MADIRTYSGKSLKELTLDGVMNGDVKHDDFRISPETLIAQAETAEQAGYTALGQNFRRAAELTAMEHQELLDIYEALRPGRNTKAQLMELAGHLEQRKKAPLNAALVREAAEVYFARGLIQAE